MSDKIRPILSAIIRRTKGKLNVPMMYLHRLIRIAPLLAMAIVVHMKLMPLISSGPLFVGGYIGNSACKAGWYWTLLFVNNYTDAKVSAEYTAYCIRRK